MNKGQLIRYLGNVFNELRGRRLVVEAFEPDRALVIASLYRDGGVGSVLLYTFPLFDAVELVDERGPLYAQGYAQPEEQGRAPETAARVNGAFAGAQRLCSCATVLLLQQGCNCGGI